MTAIRTGVGRAAAGDYEQFGASVYRDLVGKTSYLGLVAFALTGQKLTQAEEELLDDLATSSHVSEPRVWPIKITWIAGSLGRSVPAYICGAIALDSDMVGGRVAENAAEMLVALNAAVTATNDDDDAILAFVMANQHLYGFGVPFRKYDERLSAFRGALERRGHLPGKYWKLAERFWRIARESRRIEVNIIGATAALCLDLGFAPAQVAPMAVMLLTPTFLANATEAAAQSPEVLKALPAECVRYVGPPARESPRALAARARKG
jgi:hypothetical protein